MSSWIHKKLTQYPIIVAATLLAIFILLDVTKPFYVIDSADSFKDSVKHSNVIPYRPAGSDIRDQLGLNTEGRLALPLPSVERSADYIAYQLERFLLYLAFFSLIFYRHQLAKAGSKIFAGMAFIISIELISLLFINRLFDISYILSGIAAIFLAFTVTRLLELKPVMAMLGLLIITTSFFIVSDLRPYEFGDAQALTVDQLIPSIQYFNNMDISQLYNILDAAWVAIPSAATFYALVLMGQPNKSLKKWPVAFWTVAFSGFIAACIEAVQIWLPAKTVHINDVLFAMAGALLGVWIIRFLLNYAASAQSNYLLDSANRAKDLLSSPDLIIIPESQYLLSQISQQGIKIQALPFRVGRQPEAHESRPNQKVQLLLEDMYPIQLSRMHFLIFQDNKGIAIRDCKSQLGTLVNGIQIGKHSHQGLSIPLKPGNNRIIAGDHNSKFQFSIYLDIQWQSFIRLSYCSNEAISVNLVNTLPAKSRSLG